VSALSVGVRITRLLLKEIMNDKTHDDLLAMTSHLPHMLAFSLMDYLIQSHSNALDYAAGGFKLLLVENH
jgi:prephenate dehydrogenase